MNVFLIEPPDTASDLPTAGMSSAQLDPFSPSWNLMCLRAFLQKHTRHVCYFVDCRLMKDVETELVEQINHVEPPRIVVVNSPLCGLGQIVGILEIIKRHFPGIRTVLCGEFPSSYPDRICDIPRVDFALSGDPEPILRNLLDYIDVEQRLRRTPGLYRAGNPAPKPYWLPRLHGLALPEWDHFFWGAYKTGNGHGSCRAAFRLSRGHSGTSEDRNCGEQDQPLRLWPLEPAARFLSRSAQTEVKEVLLTDPPGFWTEPMLAEWIQQLLRLRNSQPWGLTILPHSYHDSLIADLRETQCRRVDILFPSCDRDVLAQYNLRIDWRGLEETIAAMRQWGIRVHPRFWVGSPEESRGEGHRIASVIRRLRFYDYRVEPFPYIIDSPFCEQYQMDSPETPTLNDWLHWARSPWTIERPLPLWNAVSGLTTIKRSLRVMHKDLQRSPYMLWTRFQRALQNRNWIAAAEDKALVWLQGLKRTRTQSRI